MRAAAIMLTLLVARTAASAPLALDEVVASARRDHPLGVAARLDVAAAAGELRAAEGAFDPIWRTRLAGVPYGYYRYLRLDTTLELPTPWWGASFFAGYRLTYGSLAAYDGKLLTGDGGELRTGVSVPLLRNGAIDRRRANITRARLAREGSTLARTQQELELVRAAALRYWDWVAAGQRVGLMRELLALARERDAALQTRTQRGDLAAIERTENERAVLQRQGQVIAAERALEQAAIELSLFLRDAAGGVVLVDAARLPAALPEPTPLDAGAFDELFAEALRRRPEVRRQRNLADQADTEARWARNQLLPAIDVSLAGAYDFGNGPPERTTPELEAALLIEIPLALRQARGRLEAAEAARGRARAQAGLARDRIAAELRDALSSLGAARRRIDAARRELAAARELETGERTRFALGDSTLLFVNLREQASAESRQREIDALADYQRGLAALRVAGGELP